MKHLFDRHQRIKYFFPLIKLERFINEWIDCTKLMSRYQLLPRIHWLKNILIYGLRLQISYKIKKNLLYCVRNMFIEFRDYIKNENDFQ